MVDSLIRLFESTAESFQTNGLGGLSEALKCEVTEERNGSFELEMEYHISGKRYPDLKLRRIIAAKPNPYDEPQPFRIYDISKPMNGLVTVKAEHISYDMSGYPVAPFSASNVAAAFSNIEANSTKIAKHPFKLWTDVDASGEFAITKPASMRSLLGGSGESILEAYGGDWEYKFDKFDVRLFKNRRRDMGVTIRYGKNMTDLRQEENCSNVYTAVYPFWYSEEWGMVELSDEPEEKILKTPGTYDYTRILPLDLSNEWNNSYEWDDPYPSTDELRELAEQYMEKNNIGVPIVSLTVSFEQLSQTKEYETMALLEMVRLCDTVHVEFPLLGVSTTAKCIKTTYNAITNKYISIELGESRTTLSDTVSEQSRAIKKQSPQTFMEKAIQSATQLIRDGLGGYVAMRSSSGGKNPDEILIMDDPDINKATKVWRWNSGGLGYSSTGYNGPYGTAVTKDGAIVADFITAGSLNAGIIRGGTLTAGGFDNADGSIEIRDDKNNLLMRMSKDGIVFAGGGKDPFTQIVKDTVTTAFVKALKVEAGSVAAENITGEVISGKTVVAGGEHDGIIEVQNSDGAVLMRMSENGLEIFDGGEDPITRIIKDTVTTSFIDALKVTAEHVEAENITGEVISGKTIRGCTIEGSTLEAKTPEGNVSCVLTPGGLKVYHIYDLNGNIAINVSGIDGTIIFFGGTCISDFEISTHNIITLTCESANVYLPSADKTGIRPLTDGNILCGSPNYKWSNVYCTKASNNTSDRNEKNSIRDIPEKYERLFHRLKPVIYRFNNGDRIHIGAISQDAEESMGEIGLSAMELAAFCKDRKMRYKTDGGGKQTEEIEYIFDEDGRPAYTYGLRYGEFIMLNTHMLQKAYKKIDSQEQQIRELKARTDGISSYLKERA